MQKPRAVNNLRKLKKEEIPKDNRQSCFYSDLEKQDAFIFQNLFLKTLYYMVQWRKVKENISLKFQLLKGITIDIKCFSIDF